jgi:hypothetical protein
MDDTWHGKRIHEYEKSKHGQYSKYPRALRWFVHSGTQAWKPSLLVNPFSQWQYEESCNQPITLTSHVLE